MSLSDNSQKIFTLHELLVDTNNNFLRAFIAHSLIMINFSFPFAALGWVLTYYQISIFLLKLYCIYGYVLYEVYYAEIDFNYIEHYNWDYADVNNNDKARSVCNKSWPTSIFVDCDWHMHQS